MKLHTALALLGAATLLVAACAPDSFPDRIVIYVVDRANDELVELVKRAVADWRACGVPIFYRLTPDVDAIPLEVVDPSLPALEGRYGVTTYKAWKQPNHIFIARGHVSYATIAHEIGHVIFAPILDELDEGGHVAASPLMNGTRVTSDARITEVDCVLARRIFGVTTCEHCVPSIENT